MKEKITIEEIQEKFGVEDIDFFCPKCEHPPSYCICDGTECKINGCCHTVECQNQSELAQECECRKKTENNLRWEE